LYLLYASIVVCAQTDGSITGVVVGQDGKPLAKAEVHIGDNRPFYGSRTIQFHETDADGKFVIRHVPWGSYIVMAGKETEGYPDTKLAFYSNMDAPTVFLSQLSPVASVTVRLSKAGILHIKSLVDEATGATVANAAVTLRRADNPEFLMTVSSSLKEILVPPTTVTLQVDAQGYESWPKSDPATKIDQINMESGKVIDLAIKLRPVADPAGEIDRIVQRTIGARKLEISHGTTITSKLSPSETDIQRLKELDGPGITALAAYLTPSKSIVDQQVVLALLSNVGGDQALDALGAFAEKAQSPVVRSKALSSLAKNGRPQDMQLIQRISIEDQDAEVRDTAAKLLRKD
jgi:hypothetical protein